MSAQVKFILEGNVEVTASAVISFRFVKALYVPYTRASGVVHITDDAFDISRVRRVQLIIDEKAVHSGMPGKVTAVNYGNDVRVVFDSMGYTLLLCQNEPYPKINSNVNLKDVIVNNLDLAEIEYEEDTPEEKYIYVKEKSTVWDAVVAYSLKATGNYPYIRGADKVCVTFGDSVFINYGDSRIMSYGGGLDTSSVLSEVYMKDESDEYSYEVNGEAAEKLGIVRKKYYALDYQWLYSPQEGLQAKIGYTDRGWNERVMVYSGYLGEDLMDFAQDCGILSGKRINYICVWGNRKGIFTKIKAYGDKYGQRV
jgi:hypothetical protein